MLIYNVLLAGFILSIKKQSASYISAVPIIEVSNNVAKPPPLRSMAIANGFVAFFK